MSFIKDIIKYMKDNPKGLWFKRKLYGWGWTPVKWQGWAVIALYVLYVVILANVFVENLNPSDDDTNGFLLRLILATVILLAICYNKGESPKWQWGLPKKKK